MRSKEMEHAMPSGHGGRASLVFELFWVVTDMFLNILIFFERCELIFIVYIKRLLYIEFNRGNCLNLN